MCVCVCVSQLVPHIFSLNKTRVRFILGFQEPVLLYPYLTLSDGLFFRYHGQIGANLILGGVDCTGNHLYTVGPYGSMDKVPYLAMGTSSLCTDRS